MSGRGSRRWWSPGGMSGGERGGKGGGKRGGWVGLEGVKGREKNR